MDTPYIVERPLSQGDLFCGRERAFRALSEQLETGERLILLTGERHIGKTSFLRQLPQRLGDHHISLYVEWTESSIDDPLFRVLNGIATALGRRSIDRQAFGVDPQACTAQFLETLFSSPGGSVHLVCFDAVPHPDDLLEHDWQRAIEVLRVTLPLSPTLAVLIAVEGTPTREALAALGDPFEIILGPLTADDTERLLTLPVRGRIAMDYPAISRVYRLTGGHPKLVAMAGAVLCERRSRAGWVSTPEVEQIVTPMFERGASCFEAMWESCDPIGRVVLAAFAGMMGQHGIAETRAIGTVLERAGVGPPRDQLIAALDQLARMRVIERLGGETWRFSGELLRQWIRHRQSVQEVARQAHLERTAPSLRLPTALLRRVDWLGLFLWLVAGLLVVLIALAWRSRDTEITWTSKPTAVPVPGTTASNVSLPPTPLPTPESGVIPGHICYVSKASPEDPWAIFVMRADGSDPIQLTDGNHNDTAPVWSPDGRRIAFVSDRDGNREVYVMNADGNEQHNLTTNGAEDWTPCWSPDGESLAFGSFRDGNWEIYLMDADGGNQQRLTQNEASDYAPSWSPDGERIAFVSNRDGNLDIYTVRVDGSDTVRFTDDEATDQSPLWWPDGSRLTWESYRDGNMEIYDANTDGSDLRNLSQDTYSDDHGAAWSPWGRRLAFFSNRDGGWDIYSLDTASGKRDNLTLSEALEQSPNWGP